jgi:hypothetical protein
MRDVQFLLSLFLFRCSAPSLICSYFDVQLLLSFVLISMFSSSSHLRGGAEQRNKNKSEEELNIEIRTNERRS